MEQNKKLKAVKGKKRCFSLKKKSQGLLQIRFFFNKSKLKDIYQYTIVWGLSSDAQDYREPEKVSCLLETQTIREPDSITGIQLLFHSVIV